jgi:hypothetical protein
MGNEVQIPLRGHEASLDRRSEAERVDVQLCCTKGKGNEVQIPRRAKPGLPSERSGEGGI